MSKQMFVFHPQRNWKSNFTLPLDITSTHVSSSKELKGRKARYSVLMYECVSSSKELKGMFTVLPSCPLPRFILKGIESLVKNYYSRGESQFHPQRNWKFAILQRNSLVCYSVFHPQRNWKSDHTNQLPSTFHNSYVSSSKELKVKGYYASLHVWLCFILKGIERGTRPPSKLTTKNECFILKGIERICC